METINSQTISLLITEVETWRLMGISKYTLEEAVKSLQITPKVVAKSSHAMWQIVLSLGEEVKQLAGSELMTKTVRSQSIWALARQGLAYMEYH